MSRQKDYQQERVEKSLKRRAAILRAANFCFAEYGYKRAKVELIAERAGVSKGLVFFLFKNKQELLTAVVEESLQQWAMLTRYRGEETRGGCLDELRNLFIVREI